MLYVQKLQNGTLRFLPNIPMSLCVDHINSILYDILKVNFLSNFFANYLTITNSFSVF